MSNTNYFSGIVKVLETPQEDFVNNQTIKTVFRAEVSQNRKNRIISLIFWGNLGYEIKNFYKINDYILIEGYISLRNKKRIIVENQSFKQVSITVLKVYPFLLNSNPNFI